MLTQNRLKEVLYYHPSSGDFVWHERISIRSIIGSQAGSLSNGYLYISIDGQKYLAHRLAWFFVHGVWPAEQIDHRNLIRHHNQIDNLRQASSSDNKCNRRVRPNSEIGLKGVRKIHGRSRPFQARVQRNGKQISLGYFRSSEEAYAAYLIGAKELHGEYAHG